MLLLFVAAALGALALFAFARDDVRAWRQAIVVGGIAREADDVGASVARRLGGDVGPLVRRDLRGLPATVVAPSRPGAAPAVVLVVPAGTDAADEQRVLGLQRGLAAAGIAGWAVRVPSEDDLVDDPDAILAGVLEAIAADPGTRDRRVSVIASGAAASIILSRASALPPGVDVPAVVAVEPLADLRALVRDALVDPSVDPALRARVGRLLVRAARDEVEGAGGSIATAVLDAAARSEDPIAALRRLPPQATSGRLRTIVDVLQARDRASFDTAWSALPQDLRARVAAVSPLASAGSVDARVLIVDVAGAGADELGDGRALTGAFEDARRLRVPADGSLPPLGELLSVSAWWLQRAGA